ncbi:helix-turn-helix transcriptional regulator [Verrucomicrobiaceae bacterium 227]
MKTKNPVLLKFGENLRKYRKKVPLSQEDLALLADLDRTYVGGLERGERNPTILSLIRLCKPLDVTPAQLLEGVK